MIQVTFESPNKNTQDTEQSQTKPPSFEGDQIKYTTQQTMFDEIDAQEA